MTKVTSIRLTDEMATKLDQLAASLDRPRAWLVEQALQRYIEEESWQVAAISEALADYRAGTSTLISHDEVMRQMDQRIASRISDADPLA